jgi:predicted MFS family arabinose efflux permease
VVLLIGVAILGLSSLPLIGHLEEAGERDADGVLTDGANIAALGNWTILKYGMAGFLMGVGSGTFFPFQSLFFRMQFNLPDTQVGTILAFSGVSLGIGAVLAGHYIGQRSLRVWAGSFRILAAPMLLLMLSPVLWLSVLGYIARALLVGSSISLNDVLTMRLVNPQQRGFASSIWNMQWAAGWAITATLSGFVQTSYGFTPLLILGAIAYVLSSVAVWLWQRDG